MKTLFLNVDINTDVLLLLIRLVTSTDTSETQYIERQSLHGTLFRI